MKILILIMLFNVALMGQVWQRCSLSDERYLIDFPILCPEPSYEGPDGPSATISPATDPGVAIFKAKDGNKGLFLAVLVIDAPASQLSGAERKAALEGLQIQIGGDDAQPAVIHKIVLRGMGGTEYFYSEGGPKGLYSRGRVFDNGNVVLVLVVRTLSRKGLYSNEATHFLNSLRVKETKKNKSIRQSSGSG